MVRPRPSHPLPSGACVLSLLGASIALAAGPAAAGAAPKPKPKPVPAVLLADVGTAGLTIASGEGHVLAIQATAPRGSRLVELAAGQEPRLIRTLPGAVGPFSVGTDAAGRAVAIADLCLPDEGSVRRRGCDLSVIDVETGTTVALPGSTTAYLGDLDRGRAVLARFAARTGARMALRSATPGKPARSMPISRVAQRAPGASGTDAATRTVTGLDLRDGVVAASVLVQNDIAGQDGLLIARGPKSRDWKLLGRVSNGDGGDGNHYFGAPVVTRTGIRAFADWGIEDASYVARWSLSGKRLAKIETEPLGANFIYGGAVLHGDTLVTLPAPGLGAEDEPQPVLGFGPLPLG